MISKHTSPGYIESILVAVVTAAILRWMFPGHWRGPGIAFWIGLTVVLLLTWAFLRRRRR